jgi:hypothetical protein
MIQTQLWGVCLAGGEQNSVLWLQRSSLGWHIVVEQPLCTLSACQDSGVLHLFPSVLVISLGFHLSSTIALCALDLVEAILFSRSRHVIQNCPISTFHSDYSDWFREGT